MAVWLLKVDGVGDASRLDGSGKTQLCVRRFRISPQLLSTRGAPSFSFLPTR